MIHDLSELMATDSTQLKLTSTFPFPDTAQIYDDAQSAKPATKNNRNSVKN